MAPSNDTFVESGGSDNDASTKPTRGDRSALADERSKGVGTILKTSNIFAASPNETSPAGSRHSAVSSAAHTGGAATILGPPDVGGGAMRVAWSTAHCADNGARPLNYRQRLTNCGATAISRTYEPDRFDVNDRWAEDTTAASAFHGHRSGASSLSLGRPEQPVAAGSNELPAVLSYGTPGGGATSSASRSVQPALLSDGTTKRLETGPWDHGKHAATEASPRIAACGGQQGTVLGGPHIIPVTIEDPAIAHESSRRGSSTAVTRSQDSTSATRETGALAATQSCESNTTPVTTTPWAYRQPSPYNFGTGSGYLHDNSFNGHYGGGCSGYYGGAGSGYYGGAGSGYYAAGFGSDALSRFAGLLDLNTWFFDQIFNVVAGIQCRLRNIGSQLSWLPQSVLHSTKAMTRLLALHVLQRIDILRPSPIFGDKPDSRPCQTDSADASNLSETSPEDVGQLNSNHLFGTTTTKSTVTPMGGINSAARCEIWRRQLRQTKRSLRTSAAVCVGIILLGAWQLFLSLKRRRLHRPSRIKRLSGPD